MHLDHHGHRIELLAEHAVFLPEHQSLVLSDVHLGKAATFRAHGVGVPEGDDARDLERIGQLVTATGATRLIIAGDLFHSPHGAVPGLHDWLERLAVPVTLVRGNHDRHPQLDGLPLDTVPHLELGTLRIVHDPAEAGPDHLSLCGHLHPVVRLRDGSRSSLRVPCFHLRESCLLLPSFGSFTGGHPITVEKTDRVFIPVGGQVSEVTALC